MSKTKSKLQRWLGLIGVVLLVCGYFAPLANVKECLKIPLTTSFYVNGKEVSIGQRTLFIENNGSHYIGCGIFGTTLQREDHVTQVDWGYVVLAFAFASAVLILAGKYKWLYATAAGAAVPCAFTFIRVGNNIVKARDELIRVDEGLAKLLSEHGYTSANVGVFHFNYLDPATTNRIQFLTAEAHALKHSWLIAAPGQFGFDWGALLLALGVIALALAATMSLFRKSGSPLDARKNPG